MHKLAHPLSEINNIFSKGKKDKCIQNNSVIFLQKLAHPLNGTDHKSQNCVVKNIVAGRGLQQNILFQKKNKLLPVP